MNDTQQTKAQAPDTPGETGTPQAGGRASLVTTLALGALFVGVVLLTVALTGPQTPPPAVPESDLAPSATPVRGAIARFVATQGESLRIDRNSVLLTTHVPTLTPAVTLTLVPATPIAWNQEDFNALTWLCYEEVRGMAEQRIDACWSVISTVRQRYAYTNAYHEESIVDTLERENQFPITFHTDRPAPDEELQNAVRQYQYGARGSCTGYLYYDSVPGGPSLCVITSSNGSFVEFHQGWR